MLHQPSQPNLSVRPVSFNEVEFTMPRHDAVSGAGLFDLLATVTYGIFPGQVLEALIARLEAAK